MRESPFLGNVTFSAQKTAKLGDQHKASSGAYHEQLKSTNGRAASQQQTQAIQRSIGTYLATSAILLQTF